jgi:hypothetical protein
VSARYIQRRNILMTLVTGVVRLAVVSTLIYCTHKRGVHHFRVMEHGDKGPPDGGPEGNNHSNVEVFWKFGQILLSVLGELINSQQLVELLVQATRPEPVNRKKVKNPILVWTVFCSFYVLPTGCMLLVSIVQALYCHPRSNRRFLYY